MSDQKFSKYMQETIDRLKEDRPVSDEVIALYCLAGNIGNLVEVAKDIHNTIDSMDQRLRFIEDHLDTLSRKDFT